MGLITHISSFLITRVLSNLGDKRIHVLALCENFFHLNKIIYSSGNLSNEFHLSELNTKTAVCIQRWDMSYSIKQISNILLFLA